VLATILLGLRLRPRNYFSRSLDRISYDVSRWGRFQDADESAYYEFVLKKAGGVGGAV